MKTALTALFVLCLALAFLPGQAWAHSASIASFSAGHTLVVSPDGPYTTIQAAISAASDGDTIQVLAGRYSGPVVVDKSLVLVGVDRPLIDGGGQGTVVTLTAPDILFRGFDLRGSGVEPDRDHAGITLSAPRITVEDNHLHEVLFGIFVAQADEAVLLRNDISSKSEYDVARKGDAIRLWYSQHVIVEGNHVHDARDVVMWYSQDVQVRDNLIERGRYGIHLMYCDRAVIEANHLVKNSVGVYTMYSNNVVLKQNDIRGHHGSSGYALGFKDADNLDVTNNVLVDNHAGAFIDGAPYTPMGYAHLFENIFAYNDIGVILQPAVNRAEFKDNVFWENAEQMAVSGSGQGKNVWLGNYWSDYTGFDADSDGQGDVPYVAERLFESLTDREPLLRALMYSPVSQAVEFAGAAFPIVRPQPKLTDTAPSIQPLSIPEFAVPAKGSPVAMFISALAVTAVGVWILWIAFGKVKMSV